MKLVCIHLSGYANVFAFLSLFSLCSLTFVYLIFVYLTFVYLTFVYLVFQ